MRKVFKLCLQDDLRRSNRFRMRNGDEAIYSVAFKI